MRQKQSIIKVGDLVKYHRESQTLNDLGFKLGDLFRIENGHDRALYVQRRNGVYAHVVNEAGDLTEFADHFAKHVCPVVLPMGVSNG